ncbi:MAG: hypothetical protein HRU09_04495 [Oligoflexales bacterium]|nr:hypothetical protein [Oligoflexales bacterium]
MLKFLKQNIILTFMLASWSSNSQGVMKVLPQNKWVRFFQEISLSLKIPVEEQILETKLPDTKLKSRVYKGGDKDGIEPLFLHFSPDTKGIEKTAKKYAKKESYYDVVAYLNRVARKPKNKSESRVKYQISKHLYQLLDKKALINKFSFPHHSLKISLDTLRRDPNSLDELAIQIKPFFSNVERERIYGKMKKNQFLSVDKDLLPSFPRKVVRRFVIYRGPNCFHASLAFHDRTLTRSNFFNVTREKGYHRAMINYDELWRILSSNFYQADHRASKIQYGDILVFFDIPEEPRKVINFRWIRHTATYLFNGYTFSKGSKSADTPYTVKTLKEEWKTWSKISKNLAVKIFRRSTKRVKKRPPKDLTDWIY